MTISYYFLSIIYKTYRPLYQESNLSYREYSQEKVKNDKNNYKNYREKSFLNGTNFLFITIVVFSILTFYYPYYFGLYFLNLYFYRFNLWTLITANFVYFIFFPYEVVFLFILLFFSYNIVKEIEFSLGTKFLIGLYFLCAAFTGMINWIIFCSSFYYSLLLISLPIGLVQGALLGLVSFIVFEAPKREWTFFNNLVLFKLKSITILLVLLGINLFSRIIFTIINYGYVSDYYKYNVGYYIFDLYGILAALIAYKIKSYFYS